MNDSFYNLSEKQLELLDLYSVNALEGKELEEAQDLILTNTDARNYLDSNYDTFAQLQDNETPSDVLFKRITNEIDSIEQSKNSKNKGLKQNNSLLSFLSGAVAASILAFALAYALWPVNNSDKNNDQNFSLASQVSAFAKEPGIINIKFHDNNGKNGPIMMMNPQGDVMVDARNVNSLDDSETYQLWVVIEADSEIKVISAGILGGKPGIYMTHISGKPIKFVITKEKGNGVEKSTQKPYYSSDTVKNI
ncbi:MAG: anti-sigma factor [Acidimicrobiia bacterium]